MNKENVAVQVSFANFAPGKAGVIDRKNYVGALLSEISSVADYADRFIVNAVCITGPNPLLYRGERLANIVNTLRTTLPFQKQTEITLHALPGSITTSELIELRDCGVTRISFDMGTFIQAELDYFGRKYSPNVIEAFAQMAQKKASFCDFDVTLYYGLPGQTKLSFLKSVEFATRFNSTHLTLLPFEGRDTLKKQDLYLAALEQIGQTSFEQYTPHHFARPGYASLWNKLTYTNQPSLGFGVKVNWMVDGVRCLNTPNVASYVAAQGNPEGTIAKMERLKPRDFEIAVLLDQLYNLGECSLASVNSDLRTRMEALRECGLLEMTGDSARLTGAGKANWLAVPTALF